MPLVYVKPQRSRKPYGTRSGRGAYKNRRPAVYGVKPYLTRRGRGGYFTDLGVKYGGIAGRYVGGLGGRLLGGFADRITGQGAYKKRPYRVRGGRGAYLTGGENSVMAPTIPRFEKDGGDDSVIISHREFIGDIVSSSSANTFKIDTFRINPGDIKTFPWLSSMVQGTFGEWKPVGLVFEYQSTSGDAFNSVNSATGFLAGAVNYDTNDADFTSRMQMENCSWAQCTKPSLNASFPVECAKNQTRNNGIFNIIQNGALPTGASKNEYFMGKLSIATGGLQGTSVTVGSLYVTYKFKLQKPIMTLPLVNAHRFDTVRSGPTSAAPMGTATASSSNITTNSICDTIGVTFNGATGTIMTLSRARLQIGMRFILYCDWIVQSGAITTPTITLSSGLSALTGYGSDGVNSGFFCPSAGVTDGKAMLVQPFQVDNTTADQTITFSAATFTAGGVPFVNIKLMQTNGNTTLNIGTVSS